MAIAPHLRPGQHILLSPGNLGSFIFRRVFDEAGIDPAANIIAELEGNLCPCRLSAKAEATVGLPIRTPRRWPPSPAAARGVHRLLRGRAGFVPNKNVFEGPSSRTTTCSTSAPPPLRRHH